MMNFEAHSHSIDVDKGYTFDFKQKVSQYMLGISGFRLEYADKRHCIRVLSISLGSSKLDPHHIYVTPNVVLTDNHSGHYAKSNSTVTVSILACVDDEDSSGVLLTGISNILSTGMNSNQTPIPTGRPVFRQAVLAGFHFSFPKDHDVHQVTIAVGSNINANASTITPTVAATMIGSPGNVATCYGSCGLMVLSKEGIQLRATPYNLSKDGWCSFGNPVENDKYIAFMTGFNLQYASGESYQVEEIRASISLNDAGEATVDAGIKDNDKHYASTARVAGVTFAYPGAS